MAEYIEREDVLKELNRNSITKKITLADGVSIFDTIKNIPTADVVEVKHGEWIILAEFADESICTECSVCGEEYTYKKGRIGNFVRSCYAKYNYCPNCGAKMDLKEGAEE